MTERAVFTADQAREAGEEIGIDWATSRFDVEQLPRSRALTSTSSRITTPASP
jgi:hypothetical protein